MFANIGDMFSIDGVLGGIGRKIQAVDPWPGPDLVKTALLKVFDPTKGVKDSVEGMAKGGMLAAGQLAVVGEKGPELFISPAAGEIIPNNQLTPGNDIAAASSNMFGGGAGDTNNVITNAPVTNSNSSTVINVQTPKMASDPNTQKQSGYALSGWAKFD